MTRPLRFLLIPLGGALLITPFIYDANAMQAIAGIACGLALISLSLRRGAIRERYGEWQKVIV